MRRAFALQSQHCIALGSPFTALLCEVIGKRLEHGTALGERVLTWRGNPDASADSVPLRLAGGLHALVRRGGAPQLATLYPRNPMPAAETLWTAVRHALASEETQLLPWLDHPPQTNEVGRSAALMAGLMVIARETQLPLALFELGASGGLNLILERYGYRLGGTSAGTLDSPLQLAPEWAGAAPPAASLRIVRRRGVDLHPLRVGDPAGRERLAAYIWPDQSERLRRVVAAIEIAREDPPPVDAGDAAGWLEEEVSAAAEPGVARVVMHSIALQYFPKSSQARIAAHLEQVGEQATLRSPLAHLSFEQDSSEGGVALRLTLWPGGAQRLLARCDAHGSSIRWLYKDALG